MKNLAAALSFAAMCAVSPTSAQAGYYQFRFIDMQCQRNSDGSPDDMYRCDSPLIPPLGNLTVGISGTSASLFSETWDWPDNPRVTYTNSGVNYTNFETVNFPLNLATGLCTSFYMCRVSASFFLDEAVSLLSGHLSLFSGADAFEMTSTGNLWEGIHKTDFMMGNQLYFRGIWQEIPEPSPVALIGAGLAGLIWVRRRKDTRAQA